MRSIVGWHLLGLKGNPVSNDKPQSLQPADHFSAIVKARRSTRAFKPDPIPDRVLQNILEDANRSPSWSNTQPYKLAIASGDVRDQLAKALGQRFDRAMSGQRAGLLGKLKMLMTPGALPDGDFKTNFEYPHDLRASRNATGRGLYELLGIARHDHQARHLQMRKNFEFFGAPTAIFVFVHGSLKEFAALDAGIFIQTLMLSAQAQGLATCAQGALASWRSPLREHFDIPPAYKLLCGVSMGYANDDKANHFNPGRADIADRLLRSTT
jgi:nitroreductase